MYFSGFNATLKTKASDWPQGYFKVKKCKACSKNFTPESPCNLYCTPTCAVEGKTTAYLMRNYKITFKDYEELLNKQKGLCAICNGPGFKMAEYHNIQLVVDHCHTTGRVRGLLCHNCNRALGLLQDSKESLEIAIKYLEGATTISKESTPKRVEAPDPTQ